MLDHYVKKEKFLFITNDFAGFDNPRILFNI